MIDYSKFHQRSTFIVLEEEEMAEESMPDRIMNQVRTWLMEDGWSIRQESRPEAIWLFIAEDRGGRKIGFGQETGKEDQLFIQFSVPVDEITANRISQLPEDERNSLIWDLRFELLRTDLEFEGIALPLKKIVVRSRIFFDAFTKDVFLYRTSQVRKGILAIQWIVARKLAQKPPQIGFKE